MTPAILLVEDHPLNRKVALAMLRRLGHVADVAVDGPGAIACVARRAYDLVLMDLYLPGLDGVATAARIRAELGARAPRIVAMTASLLDEDLAACRAAGMEDVVTKPLALDQLAAVIAGTAPRAGAAAPDPDPDPLAALRRLEAAGEPGLVASLCRQFLADSAERVGRMRRALASGAHADLHRESHSLRSSAAQLGARSLAALAGALEDLSRAGIPCDGGPWLDAIDAELVTVGSALLHLH